MPDAAQKPKEVTRYIKHEIQRELWGRAAARCQFSDCNKLLYKSPVTQEPVNLAEMAHIYSFSKDGPRGWGGIFKRNPKSLNDLINLLLVCHDCHKKIDQDKKGIKYTVDLLIKWKSEHENRVRIATGIPANKRSHVVLYQTRIAKEKSPISFAAVFEAMFPNWFPVDDRPVDLSMHTDHEDSDPAYWKTESLHLVRAFDRHVRTRVEEGEPNHFSIFGLAPQPLLILLGSLFTDKIPAVVYQPIREPRTWHWQSYPKDFRFIVNEPAAHDGRPVIVFSLSDKIIPERIHGVLGSDVSIWEVTSNEVHNDSIRSEEQLSEFRTLVRKLIVRIREANPIATQIDIFPCMAASCAIDLGRIRMPKADLPWVVHDQNNVHGKFIEALKIGATVE